MNNHTTHYTDRSRMADLLSEHHQIFSLISRLGIPLGMGDRTIREVCETNGIDTETFLYLVRFDLYPELRPSMAPSPDRLDVRLIISFLRSSHDYFLDVRLPNIGRALGEALAEAPHDIGVVVEHYYSDYTKEVHVHMGYEDKVVFPYAERLIETGMITEGYSITDFERHHDQVELKMLELKSLFLKYYTWKADLKLYSVLSDLYLSGSELQNHNDIENRIFIPCIKILEERAKQ